MPISCGVSAHSLIQFPGLDRLPPEPANVIRLHMEVYSDYRNDDNLYRALTISVQFGTVESTNKMTVLAVPAQWAGELPSHKTTSLTGDAFARVLSSSAETIQKSIAISKEDIDIGDLSRVSKDIATHKKMYDAYSEETLIAAWGTWTDTRVNAGDCLSKILDRYLHTDPQGPRIVKGTKGDGADDNYYRPLEYFKNNALATERFSNNGCWSNAVWWPLVMVGTYWRWQRDVKEGVSNKWNPAKPSDPDVVRQDCYLYIPVFSTWSAMEAKLKSIKDIFKYAYQEYSKYADLANTWKTMYYYLGGTDDIG